MTFGEKLATLRRESNYTQEQLADLLGVSRQSISKWESDIAYPETDRLKKISELFNCSLDYLLNDEITQRGGDKALESGDFLTIRFNLKNAFYEKKSSKTILGMPLWHINIGMGRTARGIFAFGIKSVGVFSFGVLSHGVVSFGALSLGVLAFGAWALGLVGCGAIALGIMSLGALSIGIMAFGACAIGEFAVGAAAFGHYFALGDAAYAMVAIGRTTVEGSLFEINHADEAAKLRIVGLLNQNVPAIYTLFKSIVVAII